MYDHTSPSNCVQGWNAPKASAATLNAQRTIRRAYCRCYAGDLEYCTLLGHRLHIDVAVYCAALMTLARYLKGPAFQTKIQNIWSLRQAKLYFGHRACVASMTQHGKYDIGFFVQSMLAPAIFL